MHKRLVAGLSRLVKMFAKQFYWYKLRALLFKLRCPGLFSSPFVSYWAHIDWLAPGYLMGAGIPPFQGKPKARSWPPASPGSPTINIYQGYFL